MENLSLTHFIIVPATALLAALLVAWLFIKKRKMLIGFVCGLIPIALVWYAVEWKLVDGCKITPEYGHGCEWAWIGILLFVAIAILVSIIYAIFFFGLAYFYEKAFVRAAKS